MQRNLQINNKRIAVNTLYMYLRMFVILGVTLYTARVIINTLGIEDYGIYNIVGGIVVLFSFINISIKNSFQRFISYELGRNDIMGMHRIVGASIRIVAIISIIFVLLSETVGLWFVMHKLQIPENRHFAALMVYHISVLTFVINLFQMPFQAIVISHEKLSFFAVYSIIDVVLKLIVVWCIFFSTADKLIFYAFLVLIVAFVNLVVISIYSKKVLTIPFFFNAKKEQYRSIFSYSAWSMINSSTVIVAQQGGNILLNIFNGVFANGAFAIANQVTAAINGFVANFQSAFNPQIVKLYAAKEYDEMYKLINRTSLFSFYLLLIISVPFLLECKYILELWLGACPKYASGFCGLMIIYFLIDAVQAPLWMLIFATGNIKGYQIWSGIINIFNIPLSATLLFMGLSVYWVFIVRVTLNLLCAIIRPIYLNHLVPTFNVQNYVSNCIVPIIKVSVIISIIVFCLYKYSTMSEIMNILVSLTTTISIVWLYGISKEEKYTITKLIKNKFSPK